MNALISFLAQYLYLLIILVAVVTFFFFEDKKKFFFFTLSSFALSDGIAMILNKLIMSPRPQIADHLTPLIPVATDNGFPSDHMLLATSVALVVFTKNKKIGTILLFLAIIVGISRVLAHAHHPIDVIGSIVISVCSISVILIAQRWYTRNG